VEFFLLLGFVGIVVLYGLVLALVFVAVFMIVCLVAFLIFSVGQFVIYLSNLVKGRPKNDSG
jgi:hypothetical protein